MISEPEDEECDARDDAQGTEAGYIIFSPVRLIFAAYGKRYKQVSGNYLPL